MVEDLRRDTPAQTVLPFPPTLDGGTACVATSRANSVRPADNRCANGREEPAEDVTRSREKKVRSYKKSHVSKVSVRRLLDVARKEGLTANSLEVRPDGTILVNTGPAQVSEDDLFAKWVDRL